MSFAKKARAEITQMIASGGTGEMVANIGSQRNAFYLEARKMGWKAASRTLPDGRLGLSLSRKLEGQLVAGVPVSEPSQGLKPKGLSNTPVYSGRFNLELVELQRGSFVSNLLPDDWYAVNTDHNVYCRLVESRRPTQWFRDIRGISPAALTVFSTDSEGQRLSSVIHFARQCWVVFIANPDHQGGVFEKVNEHMIEYLLGISGVATHFGFNRDELMSEIANVELDVVDCPRVHNISGLPLTSAEHLEWKVINE